MPRPRFYRRVAGSPFCTVFKPAGIPVGSLAEILLTLDEFEAIRLADYEGKYQDQAAEAMHISRQTFGRIIESAHKKISQALVQGKAIRIEGGEVEVQGMRTFSCLDCRHTWNEPYGTGFPGNCPACRGLRFGRADSGTGLRRGRRGGFRGGQNQG